MRLWSIVERVIAGMALVVLSPLLVAIGVAVRLTSPGPVVFRQLRVGRGGRCFQIYKFRTMCLGADRVAANISAAGDPRVTGLGRLLRASYLDELPQLVNVVKGDMSLVGPRPETPEFVALYDDTERRVLEVRPGLVGPSTLAFMDEADRLEGTDDPEEYYRSTLVHERVRLDLGYLENRSVAINLQLLLRQAAAILVRRCG